jgi:4a-hydroxytetrahydrobiopterin dehydratase
MATTDQEALVRALEELPGWQRHGDSIWKTYQFDDFATAALFVGRVADATAAGGHQPDIAIHGARVTLELVPGAGTTLTADDLTVAHRVQQLVGDHHHPVGRAAPWHPGGHLTGIRPRPVGPAGP